MIHTLLLVNGTTVKMRLDLKEVFESGLTVSVRETYVRVCSYADKKMPASGDISAE